MCGCVGTVLGGGGCVGNKLTGNVLAAPVRQAKLATGQTDRKQYQIAAEL